MQFSASNTSVLAFFQHLDILLAIIIILFHLSRLVIVDSLTTGDSLVKNKILNRKWGNLGFSRQGGVLRASKDYFDQCQRTKNFSTGGKDGFTWLIFQYHFPFK